MPETMSEPSVTDLDEQVADPRSAVLLIRRRSTPRSPLPTDVPPALEPIEGIRAVLFDVYGTLFISGSGDVGTALTGAADEVFTRALADAVPNPVGMRARLSHLPAELGERTRVAYFGAIERAHMRERARGVDVPEVEIRRIWSEVCTELVDDGLMTRGVTAPQIEMLALTYELRANPVWPMPEVGRTLRRIALGGYHLGIVSNAQFFTPLLFEALLGSTTRGLGFRGDLCAYSFAEGRAKPSVQLFDRPLRRLREINGIRPEEVLYVGNDMRNDILAAARAGCRTCLFAGDARSLRMRTEDPEVSGVEPDAVIRAPAELATVLSLQGENPHA